MEKSIDEWANEYVSTNRASGLVGSRRKKQTRILRDLREANGVAFPAVSVWVLLWWAFKIWQTLS